MDLYRKAGYNHSKVTQPIFPNIFLLLLFFFSRGRWETREAEGSRENASWSLLLEESTVLIVPQPELLLGSKGPRGSITHKDVTTDLKQ